MHRGGNFVRGKGHAFGDTDELVLNVVLTVNDGNDVCIKFFYRNIYAQKINVHLLTVSTKHARDVTVIDGIDDIFLMHVADGAVDADAHRFAKIGACERLSFFKGHFIFSLRDKAASRLFSKDG